MNLLHRWASFLLIFNESDDNVFGLFVWSARVARINQWNEQTYGKKQITLSIILYCEQVKIQHVTETMSNHQVEIWNVKCRPPCPIHIYIFLWHICFHWPIQQILYTAHSKAKMLKLWESPIRIDVLFLAERKSENIILFHVSRAVWAVYM